ncbi:MAG: hypothetical protein LW602_01750 [Sediminibacterium sp.]|nr:hypothetical protein [Sediminibacterium sp.]
MKIAIISPFIYLLLIGNVVMGQSVKKISTINENESALLDLLYKDTVNPLQIKLDGDVFKFGINPFTNSTISLLKNKKEIYIQPLGTGRLYQVKKEEKGKYRLERIDSTYFNGANFNAINFFMNDTLFQFGGDGYWHIRGYLTYFSYKTHEWELYNANRLVIAFEDVNNNLVYNINRNKRNLFLSNSFSQVDFPASLNVESIDSVYQYNIQSRLWTTLGKTNPQLKEIIETNGTLHYQMNDYSIIQTKLELIWVDFENNTFGKFKERTNSEFKENWLSIYLNNTKYNSLQFFLGNTFYLIKIDDENKLTYSSFIISKESFDLSNQQPIYIPTNKFIQLISHHLIDISLYVILGLITIAIALFWLKKRNTKKELNKEVSDILNNHFFASLTVIEKELIEILYEHHLKGGFISTKLINKIIGVQNKDVMTQNKNRSDYFLKINQKFKFATHKELPLIIKTRDELDKRQFNYGLQEAYIGELTFLKKK